MPSDTKLSQYPASPRETLFRALDNTLRADPNVRSLFSVIRSWRGGAEDKTDFAIGTAQLAAIRLTPRPGGQDFWSTDSQKGWLFVDVEILVRGTAWDDLDRAWFVVERAFFPTTLAERNVITNRLQATGAMQGHPQMMMPAIDPDYAVDGVFRGVGAFKIEYFVNLNS